MAYLDKTIVSWSILFTLIAFTIGLFKGNDVICTWWQRFNSIFCPEASTFTAKSCPHILSSPYLTSKPLPGIFSTDRTGTILITDAAYGISRTLALRLAGTGLHVLAGVRSEAEARSFIFERRKGLEPIILDVNEPAQISKVLFRIRQIRRDLDRPLMGVVLNIADIPASSLSDHSRTNTPSNHRSSSSTKHASTPPPSSFPSSLSYSSSSLGVENLDVEYKTIVKGPLRLLEMAMKMFDGSESETNVSEKPSADSDRDNDVSNQSRRGRISIILPSSFDKGFPGCGARCIVQSMLYSLVSQLSMDLVPKNISSISLVKLHSSYKSSLQNMDTSRSNSVNKEVHKNFQWVISDEEEIGSRDIMRKKRAGEEGIGMNREHECGVSAILHSIISPHPFGLYDCETESEAVPKTRDVIHSFYTMISSIRRYVRSRIKAAIGFA